MASQHDGKTVFMTEQEADRIRNTIKQRLKKCSEIAGNARQPRDSQVAIKQTTGASLLADMGAPDTDLAQTRGKGSQLPIVAVGKPYPPCVTPLQTLQPMNLADLRPDTHHRGRHLTVKRASPVVTFITRSWTMVQDEGETERLDLCLHNSKYAEDVLESASSFVIKEPYFTLTDQGEATIRVDHPSDLIVYRSKMTNGNLSSANEVKSQAKDTATTEMIARTFKDEGNTALKRQKLTLAHAMYTEGIGIARQDALSATDPDLARDLYRNRAHVNLLLRRLDEAKLDAKSALIGKEDQLSKELDSKAYFRAGCAAYDLGEYKEATKLFEKQRELAPDNKSATAYLKRIEERIREQGTGRYDFKQMKVALSKSRPRVDAADFVINTKIGESPGRGRGLFATKEIATGELVMCEKAFCVVWGHEKEALSAVTYDSRDDRIRVSPVGLSKSIVQRLLGNGSQIEKVLDLYGDYRGDDNKVLRTEDGPVVDTFRVHDIVSRNAFSPGGQFGEEDARNASTGLWVRAAYINHSCVANVEKEYVRDMMILRASRPIKSGEEIFHRYDESSDYEARQRALATTWGFECSCALCIVEKTDDPALRKRRQGLLNEADQLIAKEHWANARGLTVARAKRIWRAIDETYKEEKYRGLPRLATRRIQEWVSLASLRR